MDNIRNTINQQLKHFTNKQYNSNLLGESLEELAKRCTAKTLSGPDREANSTFVEALQGSSSDDSASKELVGVLKRRLQLDNAHKQWLSVKLVSTVLQECPEQLSYGHKRSLLEAVAEVARKPSNKTVNPNGETVSESGRKVKQAAMDLLRQHGADGQEALRGVVGLGGAAEAQRALRQARESHAGLGGGVTLGAIAEETNNSITAVTGHVELVQELLLGDSSGEFEESLINDLMSEVATYHEVFEPLLAQLAAIETPEAEMLLARALEAFDMISSCQQMYSDVMEARRQGLVGSEAAPEPGAAAQPPGEAAGPQGQQDAFDMLGLGELQSALEESQRPAAVDPFAASDPGGALGAAEPATGGLPASGAAAAAKVYAPAPEQARDPAMMDSAGHYPPQAQEAGSDPFAVLMAGGSQPAAPGAQNAYRISEAAQPAQGFSSNNPFAAAEPDAQIPQPAGGRAEDEWDMFFKERNTNPSM
uniref:VHS domain-containing protein n=1 Tax=Tetraselmis sp. GSL018 TaxID=582737 RepID=A0A061R6X8_9CHLO|mmetsp:Transcript_18207/g.43594  ORF Transcript_18207/g.43594 Transcript_18207/m.43594 type:complete len:478 (+) Transcript_18207:221-1654(+)